MTPSTSVLLVDHNPRNVELLASFLNESGYPTRGIATIDDFDRFLGALHNKRDIGLALIDVTGFDASIWDRCGKLHRAMIPFVTIARTPHADGGNQLIRNSHNAGARHTLTKPLRKQELLTLVRILTGGDD